MPRVHGRTVGIRHAQGLQQSETQGRPGSINESGVCVQHLQGGPPGELGHQALQTLRPPDIILVAERD